MLCITAKTNHNCEELFRGIEIYLEISAQSKFYSSLSHMNESGRPSLVRMFIPMLLTATALIYRGSNKGESMFHNVAFVWCSRYSL